MLAHILLLVIVLRLLYFYYSGKSRELYAATLSLILSFTFAFLFHFSAFFFYFFSMGGYGKLFELLIALLLLFYEGFGIKVLSIALIALGIGMAMKKRANRLKKGWRNLRRKLFHTFFNTALYLSAIIFPHYRPYSVILFLAATFLDKLFAIAELLPVVGKLPGELRRHYEKYKIEGSFYALLGSSLALFYRAPFAILNLAISDGFSSIFGSVFGSIKIAGSRTLEGLIFGLLGSILVAKIAGVSVVYTAVPYVLSELQNTVDDNLAMALFTALLLRLKPLA